MNAKAKNRKRNRSHRVHPVRSQEEKKLYDFEDYKVFSSGDLDEGNYEMNNQYGSSDFDYDESDDYNGRKVYQKIRRKNVA